MHASFILRQSLWTLGLDAASWSVVAGKSSFLMKSLAVSVCFLYFV